MSARLMATMPHFDADHERRGLPDRTFRDRMTVLSGDDAIDLYHFGPAPTSGDAFIVVIPGHGGVKTWRAFVDHAAQVRSSTSDR